MWPLTPDAPTFKVEHPGLGEKPAAAGWARLGIEPSMYASGQQVKTIFMGSDAQLTLKKGGVSSNRQRKEKYRYKF